eukprot:6585824-Pyramimonas_sp.AAC.1
MTIRAACWRQFLWRAGSRQPPSDANLGTRGISAPKAKAAQLHRAAVAPGCGPERGATTSKLRARRGSSGQRGSPLGGEPTA